MSDGSDNEMHIEDEDEIAVGDDDISQDDQENHETQNIQQKQKIIIEQNEKDPSMASYVFFDEDHTLGNSLRYILSKRSDVEFCGYSIPHPSENRMIVRLQCNKQKKSNEVMKNALSTISSICDILDQKLDQSVKQFQKKNK